MNKHLSNLLKFIVFLGVGLGILYFVYAKYNTAWMAQCKLEGKTMEECGTLLSKIGNDFLNVKFFWIFLVLIAFMISNISRAIRWKMLIEPLGYVPKLSNAFFTIIIGYLANMFLPRVGEVVRAATMSRYEKIPIEKLVGTIVVGRTVDVICFALAIGLTFLLEFNTLSDYLIENRSTSGDSGGGLLSNPLVLSFLGVSIFGAILLYFFRNQIMKTALYVKVAGFVKGLWEGIQTIRKMKNPFLFIFHSLNIWVMYFLMTYLAFFSFEATAGLSPLAGLMAFVFGAFGILIPSPGGMGTYHFFTSEALMIYGIPGGDAFSFANILFFSIQVGCNVLVGILSLIFLPIVNRNYEPKPKRVVS